jgi:TolB protein
MPRHHRSLALLTAGILLGLTSACLEDDGGGGGGGDINFTSGFIFVRDDNQDVYVADRSDYTKVGRLTTNGGNRHPSLSADGRQAVFVHTDASNVSSLMTVATTGGGVPRTVYVADTTAGQKNFRNPVFSPDGKLIVFTYEVLTTAYLARVEAADGTGFTSLTTAPLSYASPSFYPAAMAPNEVLVASGSSIGQYTQLERVNVSTGQILPVTNNLGPEAASISGRAVLSKDGTKVAFDARLSGVSTSVRIFVQTLSSGATLRISDSGAGSGDAVHGYPTWVSASEVAFVSNEGGANQVYVQGASLLGTGSLTLPSADQAWFGP